MVQRTQSVDGMSEVVLTDPIHTGSSDGYVLRLVDLGVVVGEPVEWPLDLTNSTDTDAVLTFTSGQRVEATVGDDTGEGYRRSQDVMSTQAIEEVDRVADERLPLVLTAEPIDLPPGEYTATAWVTAVETKDLTVTWTLEITS